MNKKQNAKRSDDVTDEMWEQVNKFNARWCLMRSRQDYLRLMNDIKEYESIHKTELEKLSSGE